MSGVHAKRAACLITITSKVNLTDSTSGAERRRKYAHYNALKRSVFPVHRIYNPQFANDTGLL